MVARHCKLGVLLLNYEIGELLRLLCRELIAKSQTVVVDAESDIYQETALIATQLNEQLVVVVADFAALAPYRLPSLVESSSLATEQRETLTHRINRTLRLAVVEAIGCVCVIHELETESAWLYDLLAFVGKGVGWYSPIVKLECCNEVAIWRRYALRHSGKGTENPYNH